MDLVFSKIEEEVITNRNNLTMYVEYVKLLQAFTTEPDKIIEYLASKEDIPMRDVWITAKQNKDGKLTRATALDTARASLINMVKLSLEEIEKSYRPIYKRWETIIEAVKIKYNVLHNNTCLGHLKHRINKYLASPLTRQVYSPKVDENLGMYLAKQNIPYNGKEYLRRVMVNFTETSKPLLSALFKNFRKTMELYNRKIDYNKLMFTKAGTSEFNLDRIEQVAISFVKYNPEDRYNHIFINTEANVHYNKDTNTTEIKYGEHFQDIMDERVYCTDLFADTIRALEHIEKWIKAAVDELPTFLLYDQAGRSTQSPDTNLDKICNAFHYKATVPLGEVKMTKDQFLNVMDHFITVVNNLIALEYEIMVEVTNTLVILYGEIDTMLKVYTVLDGGSIHRAEDK